MSSRFRTTSSVIALAAFVLVFFTLPIYATHAQEYVDSLTNDGSIQPGTGGATTHVNKPEVNKPEFIPLVQIPGITDREANIEDYINGLYTLSITAASLLVVVKLIGAGAGYVMSDVVTSKEQSKKDIRNALIGLLIILAAVTILTEINPNLRRLDFLSGVEGLDFSGDNRGEGKKNPTACEINPTKTGCKNGNMNYEEFINFKNKCAEKNGTVERKNDGSIICNEGKSTPQTNYAWEENDSNIISFFKKSCSNESCQLVFVGNSGENENEQINFCEEQEGEFDSGTYTPTGVNYTYCIK